MLHSLYSLCALAMSLIVLVTFIVLYKVLLHYSFLLHGCALKILRHNLLVVFILYIWNVGVPNKKNWRTATNELMLMRLRQHILHYFRNE